MAYRRSPILIVSFGLVEWGFGRRLVDGSSEAGSMIFSVVPIGDDRLETTNEAGQRYTFPLDELRATRKPPRPDLTVDSLPVRRPLRTLELARQAAEDYAVSHGLI